jgi:hypothetical protein
MEKQKMVQGTQLEKDESFASQLQVLSQSWNIFNLFTLFNYFIYLFYF